MRRSLAVVIFLVLVVAATPCPTLAEIAWGARTGWTGARLDGQSGLGPDLAPDLRHDFTVGVFGRIHLLEGLAFQPEVAWVRKGGQGDLSLAIIGGGQTDVLSARYRYTVNWIEVPLLLRWDVPTRGLSPYLVLGPTPAFSLGDGRTRIDSWSWSTTGGPQPARSQAEIFEGVGTFDDIKLPTTAFDLGLAGGLGLRVGRVAVEARYTHGLLDVHPSDTMKIKNQVFAVTTAIELR